MAKETDIGTVTHYYDKLGVAAVKLSGSLKLGDLVKIRKGDHEFEQAIVEMQIDRKDVRSAKKGDEIGMKVSESVKPGARVIKLA